MSKVEKNRGIQADNIKSENEDHGLATQFSLGGDDPPPSTLLHMWDELIIRSAYKDTHLPHAPCSVIEKLRTSSHQLEIVKDRYARKPLEEQIYEQCDQKVESEHDVCH